ncbi:glycosyl transferase family 2 [Pedobacter lusitanus]|uniref:Glycosyl transferase family 2 n=1 Tax=Pedobacter lusitanus TaxID=1503925 RepID=A0A0D0GKP0_9SPHI|nr:glycosyltransferase family 2 protein [Pedobacter lusitanus]KIO77777.1 glycosyl transferase family 2 [Pedobacter lusitanus]
MSEPKVAVVILNWNGKQLLKDFLPSVIKSRYNNLQLIVGDNASTDGSVDYIKNNFPEIQIIENDRNYGFAEGYNRILKQVTADYYVLLNSDVEVPENWIEPVIKAMEADPAIAAAQPKIKWQKDKTQFEYAGAAGGFLDINAFPFCRGRIFDQIEPDLGQYNQFREIFWASGAAFFIKTKQWDETGGLDPDLFAHMEEIDLCWRLKNLGYKIVYCPDAEVYHVGGGTLDANNPYKVFLNFRNNLMIMQKNLPAGEAVLSIFIRMSIDFIAWLQFLFKGKTKFAFAINKAHYQFLANLSKTGKKRAETQLSYSKHTGVYHSSVVWSYFIKGIRHFSQLKDFQ